jgi:non-ribosomal peptide synthetase component E (peptide arylation enzyme)
MLHATRPDRLARTLAVLRRWGLTPAGACAVAAIRHPDRAAVVDARGAVSFGQLQHRTNALARALRKAGVAEDNTVAVMCANHRGFIKAPYPYGGELVSQFLFARGASSRAPIGG